MSFPTTSNLNLQLPPDGASSETGNPWGDAFRANMIALDGALSAASPISGWTSYTPTMVVGSLGNGTLTGQWRREGDCMRVRIQLTIGSSTSFGLNSNNIGLSLPSGYTSNTANLGTWAEQSVGVWHYFTNGSSWTGWSGAAVIHTDSYIYLNGPSGQNRISGANNPINTSYNSNGNYITIDALVQIAQWTSSINLASDFQEFLSCDGALGVSAGASYVPSTYYGVDGSLIPSVAISSTTANTVTTYTLTPKTPFKASDSVQIEINSGSGWIPLSACQGWVAQGVVQGSTYIGIYFNISNNSISVSFSNAGRTPSATYGTAANTWASLTSWRWRVRKVSNGNMAQQSTTSITKVLDNVTGTGKGQPMDSYPLSGTFTSSGGPLKIDVSGDGWGSDAGPLTLNLKIDGVIQGVHSVYYVAGQGTLPVAKNFYVPNVPAGTHTLTLSSPSIYMSSSNAFSVIVEEFVPAGISGQSYDSIAPLTQPEIAVTGVTALTLSRCHVCSGTSNYAVTLPSATTCKGYKVDVRIATGTTALVTVTAQGSELIDGSSTRIMWAGESATLLSDGVGWTKVAGKSIPMTASLGSGVNQNFSPGASFSLLNFNYQKELKAPAGFVKPSNAQFSILRPGSYRVRLDILTSGNSSGLVTFQPILAKNGLSFILRSYGITGSQVCSCVAETTKSFSAGDLITPNAQYYGTAYTTTAIYNDSSVSYAYNDFSITEIPTW